jgi:multidrug efflux pump subunit AcrA (membrane-fusion protein)
MSVLTGLAGRLPGVRPAIRTTNIVLVLVVAALGGAAYLALRTTSSAAPASPRTSPVARGVVLSSVSAAGTVQAATNLSVGFQTSGLVTAVTVKPGEHVTAGEVLGRLDATSATAAVEQAQATLASAQANLAQAQAGETTQQKTADAAGLAQSRAQVTQAETGLKNAQAQLEADERSTKQSVTAASSTAMLKQAETQLRTDRGNLAGAVAKQKVDKSKLTVGSTTYASANAAVNALNGIVAQDKAEQQQQTQSNYDQQIRQTTDQQQLASDQASEKAATTASGEAFWQGKVDVDQGAVNADALDAQTLAKQLNATQYQLSQDEATLQTLQTLQTTLTQDETSIQGYEAKIVSDKNAEASASSARSSQIQTAQASGTSTLVKDSQAVSAAKQQMTMAKLSVASTAANNATKSVILPATLAQGQASVVQAETTLATARRTLGETVLRAPAAGTVASVGGVVGQSVSGSGISSNTASSSTSSTSGGAGASTGSSTTSSSSSSFVSLVELHGLEVTAPFSETDAAKIELGQPATITVSALPGKELAAHVVATDTVGASSSGVVEYTVTLALDRTVAGLKPGMSANASVTTGERDNVLNVPNAAVTGSGSTATVKVLANGAQSTVDVVAGLKGDSTTQILSGLTAGQQVVTSSGIALPTSTGASGTTGGTRPTTGFGGFGGGGLGGGGGLRGG